MENGKLCPAGGKCLPDTASMKRMMWVHGRESQQASVLEEQITEETPSTPLTGNKPSSAPDTGHIPNKIANWLRDCRTPLAASLDEQSNSPVKGPLRNGCSFEDDLSLGAEANHLQTPSTKPDDPVYSMPAKEKRSQFRQKGRSMNSTGSGKSSGTVSSVSELLDLYEEDPEEILYNLGFGREEPDIASKIPSRFFNCPSTAKGIDIKVYLGAQMQRMELENPNYALTSRFRQTEVLATVANVFSEIYSQVSGRPIQKIPFARETEPNEPKEPAPLKRNNSALNAAKILKRNITKPNLLAAIEAGKATSGTGADAEARGEHETPAAAQEEPPQPPDHDPKAPPKPFSSCLATVKEESPQGALDVSGNCSEQRVSPPDVAGKLDIPDVSVSEVLDQADVGLTGESDPSVTGEGRGVLSSSTPERENGALLPNPHVMHLLNQPRDSFELDEVENELQSNEDETSTGARSMSRAGSEQFLRTASQQSDSSGFAEEPSTDLSVTSLKGQESSESNDSETTVTVSTPVALEPHALSSRGSLSSQQHPADRKLEKTENSVDGSETHALSKGLPDLGRDVNSSMESESTVGSADTASTAEAESPLSEQGFCSFTELESTTETNLPSQASSSTAEADQTIEENDACPVPGPLTNEDTAMSASEKVRLALSRAEQRSPSGEERMGRVWVRGRDLLRNYDDRTRNPMRRSSSLPTSFPSPVRVVSSMRIQLGHGSVKQCTPLTYSYSYDESMEADSIAEEEEGEARPRCRSALVVNSTETETDRGSGPPYPPLNMPEHLTRSASSLYSTPADWPQRRLGEGPVWSSNSVPDLTLNTPMPLSSLPPHMQQQQQPPSHYRGATGSPYPRGFNSPVPSQSPGPTNNPYAHAHVTYGHYTQPHGVAITPPNVPYHPHGAPYDPSAPFHPYNPPLSAPYGLQGNTYSPHVPLPHLHSAPYGLQYNNVPYYQPPSCGQPYNSPFTPPAASYPCDPSITPPGMGSTEMQLRRVLHDIRGAVQSLGQQGASGQRVGTPSGTHSPHQVVQPLYEELQMRRRNLNTFRTQMTDLEMALIRQQSMVYQHLSPEQRQEAEQLQRLRLAVRQELQELELQLEDRLLAINDRICRPPLGLSRGQSMESLSSYSALRAMEPVSDLLREQLNLQSELSYDGLSAAASSSCHSSRAASPIHTSRPSPSPSPSSSSRGMALYRSSVSLTPAVPLRPGAERSPTPSEVRRRGGAESVPLQEDQRSVSGDDPSLQKERGGVGDGGGNVPLQQLIQEIKQSVADEIRQEIVNELLAAVLPRRSPMPPRESSA